VTDPHNAAVAASVETLVKDYGYDPSRFYLSKRVPGAAKRCKNDPNGCSYGIPDIVYDAGDGNYYVWEVKSVGQSSLAAGAAQGYVEWMNKANPEEIHAMVGQSFDAVPFTSGKGPMVVEGTGLGAIIYQDAQEGHKPPVPVPSRVPVLNRAPERPRLTPQLQWQSWPSMGAVLPNVGGILLATAAVVACVAACTAGAVALAAVFTTAGAVQLATG
jgi:hypothetical protein